MPDGPMLEVPKVESVPTDVPQTGECKTAMTIHKSPISFNLDDTNSVEKIPTQLALPAPPNAIAPIADCNDFARNLLFGEQGAIAVSLNEHGQIVIRQRDPFEEDADIVTINAACLPRLIERMNELLLGQRNSLKGQ